MVLYLQILGFTGNADTPEEAISGRGTAGLRVERFLILTRRHRP